MAKIREVFPADELAHKWVYGEYKRDNGERVPITTGRSDNYGRHGRANFDGDEFHSYSTVIAKRYDLGEKGILYALNTTNYGPTTAKHQGNVRSAIPRQLNGRGTWVVKWENDSRFPYTTTDLQEWNYALDTLLTKAKEQLEKAKKARDRREWVQAAGLRCVGEAITLNTLLELGRAADIEQVKLDFEGLPKYEAKPPHPNQRKYLRDWQEALEYLPSLPMIAAKVFRDDIPGILGDNFVSWTDILGLGIKDKVITKVLDAEAGSKLTLKLKLSDCPWANIKVVGDRVLTSLGVRLGRDEAIQLYEAMLDVCKNQNRTVQCQSSSVRYDKWGSLYRGVNGHYKGDIIVGCHRFNPSTLASSYKYLLEQLPKYELTLDEALANLCI